MSSRSLPRLALSLLAAALVAAACDGGEERPADRPGGEPEMEGAALLTVAGADRWSLLTVPRDGGVARARALDEPARVIWEGETRLPPAREIRLVAGPVVLLRDAEGTVHRYDPRSDRLDRVGQVAGEAVWSGWDRYGLWVESERSSVLEVGPEGSWRYELRARPRWATPVEEGRVAALVDEDEGATLWIVARGESEPSARASDGFSGPGLVTAWGKRLVLPAGDAVRFLAVPSLTASGEVAVEGTVTAMAASPSSHEIYVAVDDPPRLMRVQRFGKRVREMTELPRPARELRPAVLGSALMVADGGVPLRVPVDGGGTVRTAGEWRQDLPLALPDGSVVVPGDDGPALWRPDGESEGLDVSAGRRWAAVRWNPAPPPVVSDRVAGAGSEADSPAAEAADTASRDTSADPAARDSFPVPEGAEPSIEETEEADVLASGFYAVVTAAREPDGVRELLDRLEQGGYPTSVQTYRDDAGQTWYRGLVGPYDERGGAEAVARQLRRERDMSVWVTELKAGASTEEIFR